MLHSFDTLCAEYLSSYKSTHWESGEQQMLAVSNENLINNQNLSKLTFLLLILWFVIRSFSQILAVQLYFVFMGWIYRGWGALSGKHGPGKMCDTYFSFFSCKASALDCIYQRAMLIWYSFCLTTTFCWAKGGSLIRLDPAKLKDNFGLDFSG